MVKTAPWTLHGENSNASRAWVTLKECGSKGTGEVAQERAITFLGILQEIIAKLF